MKLSRNVLALAVALAVNVALIILLTPLGFETRPATDLKTVGYIAIGTIFLRLSRSTWRLSRFSSGEPD